MDKPVSKRPQMQGRLVIHECIVRECANCRATPTHIVTYYDNTYQYDPTGKHRMATAFEWSCTKCLLVVARLVLNKAGVETGTDPPLDNGTRNPIT